MASTKELEKKVDDLHHRFKELEYKTKDDINRLKISVLGGLSTGFFAIVLIFLTVMASNYFDPF